MKRTPFLIAFLFQIGYGETKRKRKEIIMRQVTREVANAFLNGQTKAISNSMTNGKSLYLWGHEIARFNEEGKLEISLCGYNTVTTRESTCSLSFASHSSP